MAFVFSASLFPDVRAAIGLDVDENTLPDSVLSLPIYKQETERFIERNLTEAQYTGEWADEAAYAGVLYLASLAVRTVRVVDSERLPGGNITYAKTDLKALSEQFLAQANARIGDIIGATTDGGAVADINPQAFFVKAKRKDLNGLW